MKWLSQESEVAAAGSLETSTSNDARPTAYPAIWTFIPLYGHEQ